VKPTLKSALKSQPNDDAHGNVQPMRRLYAASFGSGAREGGEGHPASGVRHPTRASLSGWVNLALGERAAKERRLRAMADAVAAYEAEFGAISAAEIAAQRRADQRGAVVVRGSRRASRRPSGHKRGAA
jgi:hypothetical protein